MYVCLAPRASKPTHLSFWHSEPASLWHAPWLPVQADSDLEDGPSSSGQASSSSSSSSGGDSRNLPKKKTKSALRRWVLVLALVGPPRAAMAANTLC